MRPSLREVGGEKPVLWTDVPKQVLEQNFFMRMEEMGNLLPVARDRKSKIFPAVYPILPSTDFLVLHHLYVLPQG